MMLINNQTHKLTEHKSSIIVSAWMYTYRSIIFVRNNFPCDKTRILLRVPTVCPGFGVSAQLSFRARQTRATLITHSSRSFIRLDEHGFPVHGRQFQDSNFAMVRAQCVGNTLGTHDVGSTTTIISRGGTRRSSQDFVARVLPFPTIRFFLDTPPITPITLISIYVYIYIYIRWMAVDLIATLITVLGSTNSFNRD